MAGLGRKPRFYRPVLAALAFACVVAGPARAADPPAKPQRLALVIGNAAYRDAPLANPLNDAADMARALEASGFTVIRRQNASLREMHLALREFGDRLGRQSTGLFYFAGHGMQVRGRNYLLPVDADVAREDEVAFAAMDLGAVMEKLDSAKNPVNIVVLDACRDNPFGQRVQLSSRGLAQVDAPPGTLIAFATAPGGTAADGTGRNGLYTQHLMKHMGRPGAPIEEVFKAVRAGVRADSRNAQVPWESTSLESAFMFKSAPPPPPVKLAAVSSPRSAPASLGAPPQLLPGDAWTYRSVNELTQGERQFTTRVTKVDGEHVAYDNGTTGDSAGNLIRVVRTADRVDVFKPSTHMYLFPLRNGATWNLKATQTVGERVYDLQIRMKVGAEETVQTAAGPMPGVRIEREVKWKQRDSDSAGVTTRTYWYNASVKRHVRSEESNVTSTGKVLTRERQELVSYAVR